MGCAYTKFYIRIARKLFGNKIGREVKEKTNIKCEGRKLRGQVAERWDDFDGTSLFTFDGHSG